MLKVFSFVKNKCSKSLEPKSKYISNFSLRKALCFGFVLFCCLGMWGQNQEVVEYKSKSSLSTLDWSDANSWEGGSIPDVSGENEITITLNANVSLTDEDIAKFFSKGKAKITVESNDSFFGTKRKLVYDNKNVYISQASYSELDWNKSENWIGGEIPDIKGDYGNILDGINGVAIFLNGDMYAKSSESDANSETIILKFNESGSDAIHIYFNGHTFEVKNAIKVGSDTTESGTIGNAGNLYLHGSGTMKVAVVEWGQDGKKSDDSWWEKYPENKLYLDNGLEFYVNQHVSPYHCKADIDNPKGTKFYLNASGMKLNWYNQCDINFTNEPIPHEEQTFYKIIDEGGNFATEGKSLTFKREGGGSQPINFKYSVSIYGLNATWTLGDDTLSNDVTDVTPAVTMLSTEESITKKLSYTGTLNTGDGIVITFRTPDDKMDMCEIRYIKGELLWTGASDTAFLEPTNYSYSEEITDLTELLKNQKVIVASAKNYPVIQDETVIKGLEIYSGANVTVNGNLTVNESISCVGIGKIDAPNGTVTFAGNGSAENPSFDAETPELSKFGKLVVADGVEFYTASDLYVENLDVKENAKFYSVYEQNDGAQVLSDLHITTSLTNNGTFTAGKVYFEPNGDTATIEPTETSISTNIDELICTSQKGKTLVINGTISVGKIALSGVANQDNARLTVKSGDNPGIIYLVEPCEDARFLELSIDDNLPTIQKGNVSNPDAEIFIMVADSNISGIDNTEQRKSFYEKGWRLPQPLDYTWTGAEGTDWFTPSNWLEHYVPCENSNVTIKVSTSDEYPTLTQNPEKLSSLIIEEGASIDFAGQDVTATTITNHGEIDFAGSKVTSDSITNNGTVRLTGKETLPSKNKITENGTVRHYRKGTEPYDGTFVWNDTYKNLVIEDGFSGTMASQFSGPFSTPAELQVSDSLTFGDKSPISAKAADGPLFSLEGSSIKLSYKKDESVNIEATENHVYNWKLAFSEAVSITSANGTVSFLGSDNSFEKGLTLDAPKSEFSNNGTFSSGDAISIKAKTFENASEKTISAQTGFSCEVTETFKNAGTITAENVDINVTTASSFQNSGKISGKSGTIKAENGNAVFAANSEVVFASGLTIDALESLVSGTISSQEQINITGNLYIDGEADLKFGELLVGTAENPKDVYISALDGSNAQNVTFSASSSENPNITVYGNFALFNGNLSLETNLTVGKDVILVNGETSGDNSIYKDNITGIQGLYAYDLVDRPAACNLSPFPTSISHDKYSSTLSLAENVTIFVGKNFYSNGVNLGTDENKWTLKIPANDKATSSFAECYNASIKNCTVVSADTSLGEAWLSTENCDGTGNTKVAFSKAILAEAQTISDSVIKVSFKDGVSGNPIEIENSCNEISELIKTIRFNVSGEISSGKVFSGSYKDLECTVKTDGEGDLSTFYLKYDIPTDGTPDYRWNTDATGKKSGTFDSTDTSGVYKEVVPNLGFVRVVYGGEPQDPKVLYTGLRDKHKNRVVFVAPEGENYNPLYTDTVDNAPPALIAVSIGQEQHETDSDAQHHYDSHNFIEWRFSEPMDFGFGDKTENVLATDDFGTITNKENGFEIAGLGEFQSGKLVLGSKSAGNEISAFYYCDEKNDETHYGADSEKTRLRLSIAGYVDEANPVTFNGESYKNWVGFIDGSNSVIPTGTFSIPSENLNKFKDFKDSRGNNCVISENQTFAVNEILLSMGDDEKAATLYGTWDLDPPKVANYSREGFITNSAQELIAVDFSYSNKAEGIQIHILDNSLYNPTEEKEEYENLAWKTGRGWKLQGELILPSPIPLDTKGGSRMTGQNQTSGGIRLSSIDVESFSCENLITGEVSTFADFSQTTTSEAFFGKSGENQFDVPYLSLKFKNITENQFLNHNYQLTYSRKDESGNVRGYITDLAGNLLEDFVANSPDKNPPDFLLSVGGVGKDKLYIIFSKPIDWKTGEQGDEGKLRRIVKSLSIFDKDDVDTGLIDFEKGSRARVLTETDKSTGIEISLTRPVSYEEIKTLHIGVNIFQSGAADSDGDKANIDPISGIPGSFSMLYDMFENPISATSKHIFTDFAVNALDVLYAYDGRNEETAIAGQGVLGGNQWLITDFSETPNPQNRVLADKDISIFATIKDEAENKENQDVFTMFADISPNKNATGDDFEVYTALNPRLWFADSIKFYDLETNNSSVSENFVTDNLVLGDGKVVGKIEAEISGERNQNFNYVIPNDVNSDESLNWDSGSEIQFVFKVYDSDGNAIWVDGDVNGEIDESIDSSDHPLYAVRLKDESDLSSIDLWSLNILDIVQQKGGVTILNNVIDSFNDEKTVVEVDVATAGNLTVQVLTLDGNVVKVLQRGRVDSGKYYYHWDGKNIAGDSVARGMYFIRVVGPNLDETRKVMVVQN